MPLAALQKDDKLFIAHYSLRESLRSLGALRFTFEEVCFHF
jgi:hypothetical protein